MIPMKIPAAGHLIMLTSLLVTHGAFADVTGGKWAAHRPSTESFPFAFEPCAARSRRVRRAQDLQDSQPGHVDHPSPDPTPVILRKETW